MKTESAIPIYETNSTETSLDETKEVKVRNHWNRRELVVLEIDGNAYTVSAGDLQRAIEAAQKAHRY